MANKNLNKLQTLSAQYNVPFQALYTKEAIAKGNLQVVHKALINGKQVNCLQQMNNTDLENLFKNASCGHDRIHAPENTVIFEKNDDKVSINGNRYRIFDIIKDVDFKTLNDMLGDYLTNGEEWQVATAQKIKDYMKNGGLVEWLEYQYEKEYGETVDEYAERMGVGV